MPDLNEQPEEVFSEKQQKTIVSETEIREYPTYLSTEQDQP